MGFMRDARCQNGWAETLTETVANEYDMTQAEAASALQNGATLAQLAPSSAKLLSLKETLIYQRYERVDKAVAGGLIDEEKGETLKLIVPQSIERLVENGGGPYWGQGVVGGRMWGVWRDEAASYLNLSTTDMAASLLLGESLGQLAESQGVEGDGLVEALLAGIQARGDLAVDVGFLSPEKADWASQKLHTIVSFLINSHGPCSFKFNLSNRWFKR
jgi:hypothetical protein